MLAFCQATWNEGKTITWIKLISNPLLVSFIANDAFFFPTSEGSSCQQSIIMRTGSYVSQIKVLHTKLVEGEDTFMGWKLYQAGQDCSINYMLDMSYTNLHHQRLINQTFKSKHINKTPSDCRQITCMHLVLLWIHFLHDSCYMATGKI